MEPEGSSQSQLFNSLKLYLNKENRLQPIIGLESIVECVNVNTMNREALFLCEVCVCRLSKADMRNHVLGSLHRFNYIRACHPQLASKWQANSDLSELAWPLMELAKTLEGKDGPGNVQLFEVEDAVYKKMATQSENDALTLIKNLREGQAESWNFPETLHYPVTSERVVLFSQKQPRDPPESKKADAKSFEMTTHTSTRLPQVPADVVPPDKSTEQLEMMQTSLEPLVLPEYSNSFFDEYSGDKPLIGLVRVVEFRSEDGYSYCFLCHCCRIRCSKKDIVAHLFSSSHIINYLMEIHSNTVEVIGEDIEDNCQLLQSLAKKVEQDEGRGEMKVVQVPESQCKQLTGKSYHWCLKMLPSHWTDSYIENEIEAFKGVCVNKTGVECISKTSTKMMSGVKPKKKKKIHSKTVFNVSLPLPRGEMLLQGRTSFSADNLLEFSALCDSDYDPVYSPDSDTVDCSLECDASSFPVTHVEDTSDFQTSPLQQELYLGQSDTDQYMPGYNSDSAFQDENCYGRRNMLFNQFQDITGPEKTRVYGDWKYNRQHDFHEKSSYDTPTQSQSCFPAMPHSQDGPSYNFYSTQPRGVAAQCYSKIGVGGEGSRWERDYEDMSSNAAQHYYPQQCQSQQMAWANANVPSGNTWGFHNKYDEVPPYLDTPRDRNMQSQCGSNPLQSGCVSSGPPVPLHNADLRQTCALLAVNHFQAAQHNYMMQSTTYQAGQADSRLMSSNNYNVGPWSNPIQHSPYPASSTSGGWDMRQVNAGIQPGQPLYQETCSDDYFRAAAPFRHF